MKKEVDLLPTKLDCDLIKTKFENIIRTNRDWQNDLKKKKVFKELGIDTL